MTLRTRGAHTVRISCLALGLSLLAPGATAAGTGERLPDLRMANLRDFRIETLGDGSKRLRVSTIAVNVGRGQFELRATRPDASHDVMTVQQRIFNDAGTTQYIDTAATMRYAGDGHSHWHVQKFITLELYRASTPEVAWRLNKIGFCVIDALSHNSALPGYSSTRRYVGSTGCGTSSSTALRPGISIGWADYYPWDFVRQWVGLPPDFPADIYRLCATVDPRHQFRELSESNNWTWHDLYIDTATNTVNEVGRGRSECRPGRTTAARSVR
jgi:hypothetical protein